MSWGSRWILPMFVSSSSVEVRRKPQSNPPRRAERVWPKPTKARSSGVGVASLARHVASSSQAGTFRLSVYFNSRVLASNLAALALHLLTPCVEDRLCLLLFWSSCFSGLERGREQKRLHGRGFSQNWSRSTSRLKCSFSDSNGLNGLTPSQGFSSGAADAKGWMAVSRGLSCVWRDT